MTGMPRVENWERRLVQAIAAAQAQPFVWGQQDCATWTFDVRRALTGGPDHAALWRGRYHTALGSRRVLRLLGWPSLEAGARALLGDPRASPRLAQRGDLVLGGAPAPAPEAFGICIGAQAAFLSPEGLVTLPFSSLRLAWEP
jgi:hypothetical protein